MFSEILLNKLIKYDHLKFIYIMYVCVINKSHFPNQKEADKK